jgi:transcriptional regulator with XRE-family HTH domain
MTNVDLIYIKDRRNELKLSLKSVASQLGFKNASTYLKYEKGVYSFKAEQLPVLANALKCEITDFFY